MSPNAHTRRSPIRSLLALAPVLIGAPWLALWYHWDLPTPQTALYDPATNLPQLSETRILDIARHLSEEIGYRTVGTYEHALGDAWMVQQAEEMKRDCDRVVSASKGARKLECEVWHQVGSGSHRFDMMNKRLYKTYVGLTNIVVRVSDGTEEGKAHSVLVNAHVDSTLPSPGAADDALPVGIMMECIRVLVGTPTWEPKHAIVFLFNNAEESLQDGSHLFTTQHPIAPTVRAVINLEAAGTTGREILFQATSEEMIEAYSHVPRPFGTIFANDIFSSGFILSDTDFRQFEQYLNVTGLDMAVVGNSYLYHMRKDLVENIQPGVATNMGLNVLALLRHLTSPASPLPGLAESGYTKPSTVFFSYLGWFFVYSFDQALWAYSIFGVVVVAYVWVVGAGPRDDEDKVNVNKLNGTVNGSAKYKPLANGLTKPLANGLTKLPTPHPTSTPRPILTSLLALTSTLLLTLLFPNLTAFLLASPSLLHKSMSWFSNEYSVLPLFAPPALLGALSAHLLLAPHFLRSYSPAQMERLTMNAVLLLQTALAVLVQALGVGSAAILILNAVPMFLILALTHLSAPSPRVPTWVYALAQWFPLLGGTMLLTPVIEFFVPLTGRIGQGPVPADNIIATIVSCILTLALPLTLPFLYRFERGQVWTGWVRVALVVGVAVGVFAGRAAFDGMHQRRVFVLWREEVGGGGVGERSLHVAGADGAPGLGELVGDIARVFGDPEVFRVGDGALGERLVPIMMDQYNSDWDTLYPFSSFLTPYKIPLAPAAAAINGSTSESVGKFAITAVDDVRDAVGGTRSLTLRVHHPGLIWTVIAFDAHVLKWNLDDNPPDEYVRHHVKESSFYGRDTWELDLVLSLRPRGAGDDMEQGREGDGELAISFMGIQEKGMWPGKKGVKEEGGAAMVLFEELDGWVERRTGGTVDAMLLGCVGGVVRV